MWLAAQAANGVVFMSPSKWAGVGLVQVICLCEIAKTIYFFYQSRLDEQELSCYDKVVKVAKSR